MRVLLVEDERPLAEAIRRLLEQEHYMVDVSVNGLDGVDNALSGIYDAMVLDVMLPGMDGFTVLQKVREANSTLPVLMLTARGDVQDRVQGLNLGADYYLPKPFESSELLACLNTITRRKEALPVNSLSFAGLVLEKESASIFCEETGKRVQLSGKEYQLMELFLRNPGQLLPKEMIVERVWGFDNEAEYNNLSVYLTFLRRKIAFVGARVEINATRSIGYRLEEMK